MHKTIAAFTILHEKIMHAYKKTNNNELKSMAKWLEVLKMKPSHGCVPLNLNDSRRDENPSLSLSAFRGRILGRNPDKSLQTFPPCYSQSPVQFLPWYLYFSNSRNLLQFLEFSYRTLQRRKEKK
jgi:hypothetical protein